MKEEACRHAKGFGFYSEHTGRVLETLSQTGVESLEGNRNGKLPDPCVGIAGIMRLRTQSLGLGAWLPGSFLIQLYMVMHVSCFG